MRIPEILEASRVQGYIMPVLKTRAILAYTVPRIRGMSHWRMYGTEYERDCFARGACLLENIIQGGYFLAMASRRRYSVDYFVLFLGCSLQAV